MLLHVFEKIMLVVQPLALAALLIYVYGLFYRAIRHTVILNALMGIMFGFAAAVAMASPIPIADGIIVDIRNLFVGMAAAYFGIIGGLFALIGGVAMRVSVGGSGVMLGIASMFMATIMGLIWATFVRPRIRQDFKAFLVLGGMISMHLVIAVFLPASVRSDFFIGLAPTLLIANLIGAVLLSKLILRERGLVDESHRLLNEATTDPLTKLVNRKSAAATFTRLPDVHDKALGQTMLCIDVDGFKDINDAHGHLRGDKVLVDIATRLSSCLRPDDIFSRVSGDEFVIVLHAINTQQAQTISERCRDVIGSYPIIADGQEIKVSISIGGVWTQSRPSFKALRKCADDALYRAKEMGRDCVVFEVDAEATLLPQRAVA